MFINWENNKFYLILAVIVFIIILVIWFNRHRLTEGFNENSGQFCRTCEGKTFNQCSSCFNCGYCVDRYGNAECIGGDHKGPYNFERCDRWYSGDPYSYMLQQNANYGCQGPRSSNRLIGV